jgi:hypothetical protein
LDGSGLQAAALTHNEDAMALDNTALEAAVYTASGVVQKPNLPLSGRLKFSAFIFVLVGSIDLNVVGLSLYHCSLLKNAWWFKNLLSFCQLSKTIILKPKFKYNQKGNIWFLKGGFKAPHGTALQGTCRVAPGTPLLLSVSGGVDSMALLHLLARGLL